MLHWKWPYSFAIPCPLPAPPASDGTPSLGPTDVSEGLTVPNCLPAGDENTSGQSVVTNTPAKQIRPTQQLQCLTPTHLALPAAFSLSVTHHNDSHTSWQAASCSALRLMVLLVVWVSSGLWSSRCFPSRSLWESLKHLQISVAKKPQKLHRLLYQKQTKVHVCFGERCFSPFSWMCFWRIPSKESFSLFHSHSW